MGLLLFLAIMVKISFVVSMCLAEFETTTGCRGDMRYNFYNPTIIRTTSELGCGRECRKIPSCLAFNARKDGASTICELGNQETAHGNCSKLQVSDGSTYMEKIKPCENGGHWDVAAAACVGCIYEYTGTYCERLFTGCKEAANAQGKLTIQTTPTNKPIDVVCLYQRTVIEQRGYPGSVLNFNRTWSEYKHGFGDMHVGSISNFFLGLERIHEITSTSDCSFNLNAAVLNTCSYNSWVIASEDESYKMNYNDYQTGGSLDDGLVDFKSAKFSTHDRGNASSCAAETGSGWWFNADCSGVNMHKPKLGGNVLQWPSNRIQTDFPNFFVYMYC